MKKTLLTTCNAKYIHKNLALRWIYTTCPNKEDVILKEYTIKDDSHRIIEDILSMQVEVVCFSCYIWNIEKTKEIIKELKKRQNDIHIFVGGPEVSFSSFELLEEGVDAICIGEGEESVWEYIQMLETKPREIRGIYTKQFPNKEYRKVDLAWLETFEDPYFLSMDINDMGKRYLYLETSRGCPYGCTYCLSSTDRSVRMFSEDYVINLLEQISKSDVKQVKFLDRTFNSNPQRALRIARYINEHCKNQIFQFEIVAETLSEDLLQFFCEEADVSRFRFEVGVQSFKEKTLASVGRIQNNARLVEVLHRLKQAGCILHVDLIAGLPYEGMQSFEQSFNTLFSLQAGEVQLGILKLLKGTKLRSQQEEFSFDYHEHAPYDVVSTAWLSQEEMRKIHQCADAVEKFWNSGVCRDVLRLVLEKNWYTSAFLMFMDLGKEYAKLKRPYQPYELFQCLYPLLKCTKKEADAIILTYYNRRFKQKPKRFIQNYLTQEKKNELLRFAFEKGVANQQQLFCYGLADVRKLSYERNYDCDKQCA